MMAVPRAHESRGGRSRDSGGGVGRKRAGARGPIIRAHEERLSHRLEIGPDRVEAEAGTRHGIRHVIL